MWVDFTAQVYNEKVGNHKEALETTNVVFLKLSPDMFVSGASQVMLVVKNLPANAGDIRDVGSIPGPGRSPGGGHGIHSSIPAWRIPWTEEPGGLQSIGSQRVTHN